MKNILFIFFAVGLFSCVSKKKLDDAVLEKEQMRVTLLKSEKNLEQAEARITASGETIRAQNIEIESLKNDMISLNNMIGRLENEARASNERADRLNREMDDLVKNKTEERGNLQEQLFAVNDSLNKRQIALNELENNLSIKEAKVSKLEAELYKAQADMQTREQRLNELESILAQKDSMVNALNNTVESALTGFKNSGLNVSKKDGKVYVSLAEQLLFASGSTQIDPRGKQALKELAKILEENTEINILVEGHTDDVPLNGSGAMRDNWDLSVLRATAVTRILTEGTSVNPARITAGGRGQFIPINPGKTTEARRSNRRTEIILTPKLNDLFKIIE